MFDYWADPSTKELHARTGVSFIWNIRDEGLHGGGAVVVLHHFAPLQRLQRVGIVHRLLDGHRILAGPLADLLVHLGHLLRVHGPEAALPLVRPVHGRLFNLLEAFVEGEVVTDRVLPAVRGRLEVGKVLTKKRKECK